MKQDNSISSLTRSQCKLYQHSGGSMLLNIIIIIVIFASISAAVVYMSSSSLRQAVSSNQGANAWNMAEAGYRFLSASYIKTANTSVLATADYDKAVFLDSVDGRTYIIPNNGSFKLTVTPYWFYNTAATAGRNISVRLPGTTPTGFTMPATGQVKVGNTPGANIKTYNQGTFNSGTGIFACRLASNTTVNKGDSVYLVLNPVSPFTDNSSNTSLIQGKKLYLNLNTFSASAAAFPDRDGLIEIGSESRLYRYDKATVNGAVLTLTNLQHSDKSTFSTPITTATTVTFKKYLMATSQGKVANEERTLSFSQAILDSIASTAVSATLDTPAELAANFTRSSSVGSNYVTSQLTTSGGGKAWFSIIKSLSGATPRCGAFWYSNTSLINTLWGPPPVGSGLSLLSYDVQLKAATGNALTAGTIGLAIRAQKVATGATEPDTYLGLTFMKYNLPNLYFINGSTAINPGGTVVGQTSGTTGIVQGTPEITSGSWTTGDAKGKIRFASVTGGTGTFSNNEYLRVNGVNNVARMPASGTNYFSAATDYIPDAIKPKPSDFSPSRYNIGPLLLVLWERKVDAAGVVTTLRWLAFKDISNDDYAKGLQDFVEPAGSCTGSLCTGSDGQIVNDDASIYIRIQEKRVVLGSGSAVKLNDINVFYGDDSSRYVTPTWPARNGDTIPYNINALRRRYMAGAAPFTPVWAPDYINQWAATVDYFSHIESGTPTGSQPQFQWDAVNPSALAAITSGGGVLKICDDGSAACTSSENGTLRLTELITPNYSTTITPTTAPTYLQPEIGMIACGAVTESPYSTAGFAEFAIRTPESSYGGFVDTTLYW